MAITCMAQCAIGTYLQVDEQDQLERGKRLGVVGRLEESQTKCGPKYSKFSTKASKKLDRFWFKIARNSLKSRDDEGASALNKSKKLNDKKQRAKKPANGEKQRFSLHQNGKLYLINFKK